MKPIKRFVKMTFRPEEVPKFLQIFKESCSKIRAFEGCNHVELLELVDQPNVLCTLSYWDSPDSLEAYRNSELFKETWAKTKALFSDKPEAWSLYQKL